MRKRILGTLVGVVLSTTLCMNVGATDTNASLYEGTTVQTLPLVTKERTRKTQETLTNSMPMQESLQAHDTDTTADVSTDDVSTEELGLSPLKQGSPLVDTAIAMFNQPFFVSQLTVDNMESATTSDPLEEEQQQPPSDTIADLPPEVTGPQLLVNGTAVDNVAVSMCNDTTYVSIRSLVTALDPTASVSWENGQLLARGNGFELMARPNDLYLVVNNRYLYVPDAILYSNDTTMAPIRTICTALGASTQWDLTTGDITVQTNGAPLSSGASFYREDDLYWLSRIITAESRNQPLKGKIGVGTVIMNRVESPSFPNTIHAVIFSGTQFSPVQNGSIYNTPSADSVLAAKLVLDGAREAGDSLFFNRAGLNCWAARNKTHVTTIADHSFYL